VNGQRTDDRGQSHACPEQGRGKRKRVDAEYKSPSAQRPRLISPRPWAGGAKLSSRRSAEPEPGSRSPQRSLKCKYCGFNTHRDFIKAAFWTDKGLIVVEDIPAQLCEGCGEHFFQEAITQKIRKVLTYPSAKAKRQIHVPVYSLGQVGKGKSNSKNQSAIRLADKNCGIP